MDYILSEYTNKNNKNAFNATNKARNDTITIAVRAGYKHEPLYHSGVSKPKIIFELIFNSLRLSLKAGKGDRILIQYPYFPPIVNDVLFFILNMGQKIRKYDIQIIIHDILFMRNDDVFQKSMSYNANKEFKKFSNASRIIVHNKRMAKIFSLNTAIKNKLSVLGPFYYLYDKKVEKPEYSESPQIIIAGNLDKNKTAYIYKLKELKKLKFNLYGVGFTDEGAENLKYFGKFLPEELIENLKGNFGLVWDGDSIDTCSGTFGNYLKYNNPHKLSLYLTAGIPVIVWSESALAPFVIKKNVGIAVDSLRELEKKLAELTPEKYAEMTENVSRIRTDLITGKRLEELLKG